MKDNTPKPTMAEIIAQNEKLKLEIEKMLSQNVALYAENKELRKRAK